MHVYKSDFKEKKGLVICDFGAENKAKLKHRGAKKLFQTLFSLFLSN